MLAQTPRHLAFLHLALAALALVLPWCLAACGKNEPLVTQATPATGPTKIRAVATVGMVADLVRNVAGDRAEVTVLLGPGTDPHLYKPTPGDLRTLENASIIFSSGLTLEGKMEQTLTSLATQRPTVAVTDAIARDKLMAAADHPGAYDPHVWFDVALWSGTITAVEEALAKLDPEHAREYRANASAYLAKLTELDVRVRQRIAAIPKEKRVLVTAHDAFGYFGRAYDVEVLGVQGMSTESEASLKDINDLVNTLVTRGIPAVFVESSVPKKNIEALLQGAASRGHVIRIGGELYSDAMGAAGTPEGTYVGMVEHNVRTITEVLK